ncbi:MAG: hypothetical protein WDZ89_03415 [Gemmatimonadota bacterium]
MRRCPRCGHRGDGIAYFRRPGHIALLVFFSLFTYGIGGLIYWLVKRQHSICPNCGLDWQTLPLTGVDRRPELTRGPGGADPVGSPPVRLPRNGIFRRILGVGATIVSVALVMIGVFELEVGLIVTGSLTAGAGALTYWWGWTALQSRRQALLHALQRQVLLLASRKGGTLTVTEVATELDLSIPMAEKVMMSMDDGFRIRSDVTDEGLLLYEFPELRHREDVDASHRIEPGTGFRG